MLKKTDGFWILLITYCSGVSNPLELTIDDLYYETTDELTLKSDYLTTQISDLIENTFTHFIINSK